MRSSLQLGDILLDRSSTDTGVAVDVHVVTEGDDDLLDLLGEFSGGSQDQSLGLSEGHVDLPIIFRFESASLLSSKNPLVSEARETTHPLQDRDGESSGLSGTRLSLGDNVPTSDDGHDSSLLNGRGSLETVSVDTSEELGLELHVVEADERGNNEQKASCGVSAVLSWTATPSWCGTHLSVTVSQLDSMRASSICNPEVSPEPVAAGGTSLVVLYKVISE